MSQTGKRVVNLEQKEGQGDWNLENEKRVVSDEARGDKRASHTLIINDLCSMVLFFKKNYTHTRTPWVEYIYTKILAVVICGQK